MNWGHKSLPWPRGCCSCRQDTGQGASSGQALPADTVLAKGVLGTAEATASLTCRPSGAFRCTRTPHSAPNTPRAPRTLPSHPPPPPGHQGECTGAAMPRHSWVTAATRPLSTRKPPCPRERDMLTGHQPPPGKGELWPCADLGQRGSAGRKVPQAASTPAPHPAKQSQFGPGGWGRDSQSGASGTPRAPRQGHHSADGRKEKQREAAPGYQPF